MGTTTRVTCAMLLALVSLAGCGDDDDPTTVDDRTSVSWVDTDVCALVEDDEVSALIGPDAEPRAKQTDPGRPECAWRVSGTTRRLVLRLWQPPVPKALTEDVARTTEVGGRPAYVEAEDRDSCTMHVEAEPAWLSVDLAVPHDGFRPRLCDAVAPTADQVLAFVK